MTNKIPGHIIRKVTALLAKTTDKTGCTAGEKLSAYQLAVDTCAKHQIDRSRFAGWPDHDRVDQWKAMVGDGNGAANEVAAKPEPVEVPAKPKRQKKVVADKPKKVKRPDRLMDLMQRDIGVSLAELMGEFSVQQHTARAYISVVTRNRGFKAVLRDGRYYLLRKGA